MGLGGGVRGGVGLEDGVVGRICLVTAGAGLAGGVDLKGGGGPVSSRSFISFCKRTSTKNLVPSDSYRQAVSS